MMDKVRTGFTFVMMGIIFVFAVILEVIASVCYGISKACIIIRFMWMDCYILVNQWDNNLIELKKDLPLFGYKKSQLSIR